MPMEEKIRVYGLDFTSSPANRQPLALCICSFEKGVLRIEALKNWDSYLPLVDLLDSAGPWVMGIDFPFSQSSSLLKETNGHILGMKWPVSWDEYVQNISELSSNEFRTLMKSCPRNQAGIQERRRETDSKKQAQSPQHVDNPAVGLMFYRGANLLRKSPVSVVPQRMRADDRIVFEAYPGAFARFFFKDTGYKKSKKEQRDVCSTKREMMLESTRSARFRDTYGFTVSFGEDDARLMCEDHKGDLLDSFICAFQAAWAWTKRHENYGLPCDIDPDVLAFEGWIMDPHCLKRQ